MKKISIIDLLIFITATELVGIFSSFVSGNSQSVYYSELTSPPLSPPNRVFPVVWVILYSLMGASAYIIYQDNKNNSNNLKIYALQLFVNFIWSIVFFRFHLTGISIIILLILILLVLRMIIKFKKINVVSAYINIPYLIWLLFALYLNIGIFILN